MCWLCFCIQQKVCVRDLSVSLGLGDMCKRQSTRSSAWAGRCALVCVCVCEREREREIGREVQRVDRCQGLLHGLGRAHRCVCVCVCVRERERERERASERERAKEGGADWAESTGESVCVGVGAICADHLTLRCSVV